MTEEKSFILWLLLFFLYFIFFLVRRFISVLGGGGPNEEINRSNGRKRWVMFQLPTAELFFLEIQRNVFLYSVFMYKYLFFLFSRKVLLIDLFFFCLIGLFLSLVILLFY